MAFHRLVAAGLSPQLGKKRSPNRAGKVFSPRGVPAPEVQLLPFWTSRKPQVGRHGVGTSTFHVFSQALIEELTHLAEVLNGAVVHIKRTEEGTFLSDDNLPKHLPQLR